MPPELTGHEGPESFSVFWAEHGGERAEAVRQYTAKLSGHSLLVVPVTETLIVPPQVPDYPTPAQIESTSY